MTWSRLEWKERKDKVWDFLWDRPKSTLKEISNGTNFGLGDTKKILTRLRRDHKLKIYPVIHAYALS